MKIDNITINTKYITFIDWSADIYNFDDGNMPGVIIELSTGRTFEYTGHKANEVREILLRQSLTGASKRSGAINKIAFYHQLNNLMLPDIKRWHDIELFNWLDEHGYIWRYGMWSFC